jgi:hypothetical protein
MHVERKQGSDMGFHLVLERKMHIERMIKWVQPRTQKKMFMCKKRIKVIRGFERENTHKERVIKSFNKGLSRFVHMKRKHGSKGILTWFLKENAHREIMIRRV